MRSSSTRSVLGLLMHIVLAVLLTGALLLTAGLFLWSHIKRLASVEVDVSIDLGSESLYSYSETVYTLKIVKTIGDLWDSGSYALSILITMWSLAFPYIKIIALLCLVWLPIRHPTRNVWLNIADQLGKFSLLDAFVVVLLVPSMYNELEGDITFGTLSLDLDGYLQINPENGIVMFSVAVLISMLLSLCALECHHRFPSWNSDGSGGGSVEMPQSTSAVARPESTDFSVVDTGFQSRFCPCIPPKYRLHTPVAFVSFESGGNWCKHFVLRVAMLVTTVLCVALLIAAFSTDFVKIKYGGAVADYLDTSERTYSYFNLSKATLSATSEKSYGTWLCIVYALLVIAFPILSTILLSVLWFVPLPEFIYVRMREIIWGLHAWSAMDVMILTTFAVMFELPSLYDWMVDEQFSDFCEELEDYLSSDSCLTLNVDPMSGSYFALVYVIGMWVVTVYTVFYTDKSAIRHPAHAYTPVTGDEDQPLFDTQI